MSRPKKIDIRLSKEIVEVLQGMAEHNQTDVLIEVKRSIRDRVFFQQKIREGYDILIRNDEETVQVDYK